MTERRPHWDDELIHAVFRRMDGYAAGVVRSETDHGTPTFDIIAAVEDWQRQKLRSDGTQCAIRQEPQCECCYDVRELDAAIQRVRAVCYRELIDAPLKMMSPGRLGYRDALRNILRALDGGDA